MIANESDLALSSTEYRQQETNPFSLVPKLMLLGVGALMMLLLNIK